MWGSQKKTDERNLALCHLDWEVKKRVLLRIYQRWASIVKKEEMSQKANDMIKSVFLLNSREGEIWKSIISKA